MNKNHLWALLPLILLLVCLLAVSGCRPSTALTQLRNASIALNPSTEDMLTDEEEEEDSPDDEDPVEEQSDDAQLQEETTTVGQFIEELLEDEATADQALQAIYDVLAESDEWGEEAINTEDIQASDDSDSTSAAVQGNATDEASEQSGGEIDADAENSSGVGENSSDGNHESTNIQANENEGVSTENSGGSNNDESSKQLVDEKGDYVELETAEGKVAATGQLAILVSMLGGADRLCATSADYDENELAQKAFSGGDYQVFWSGDGSSPMSDESFQKLLDMNPGLCVEISGYSTFSESQVEQLERAGITYAALPGFSSAEDVEQTVALLGDLLGDTSGDGGTNAPEIAQAYIDWCDSIKSELASASVAAATTVFIEDWDGDVQIEYGVQEWIDTGAHMGYWEDTGRTLLADTGAAVIRVGSLFRPLSDYMAYSNVTDFSAQPYTSQSTGYIWQEYTSANSNRPGQTLSGQLCYITPLRSYFYGTVSGTLYFWSTGQLTGGTAASQIINAASNYSNNLSLGSVPGLGDEDSGFTTVIVRDQETKGDLAASLSWQTNDTTGTIGYENVSGTTASGATTGTTITLPADSAVSSPYAYSNISGEYEVYVNPTGLGDWVDGSAESILEAVWIAWVVQDCYSQSQAEALIQDFYQSFYGYTLSDSEMAAILAGPAS